MSKPASAPPASPAAPPSRALVSAALAGLLCASTPACESTKVDNGTQNVTGPICCTGGASASGSGGASSTGGAVTSDAGLSSGGSVQGAGGTDAAVASAGGADGGSILPPSRDAGAPCRMDSAAPVVTSSTIVTDMTQEKFTADCDARHGVVEIPPHCGGFNTCMGFSWWADTGELTEHTCRGMSSCVGFSCVVCPTTT